MFHFTFSITIMEDKEKQKSAQESLQLIESMINRARDSFGESGHLYLLWGWVILICSVTHFILWHYQMVQHPYMIWIFTWAAVIYQSIYLIKRKNLRRVKTYTSDILGSVWTVFVICMFLMVFIMIKKNAFEKGYPMFLVLYGMPTFLSGKILKVPALTVGGIWCWILAVVATFIPLKFQLLLIALAVVVAWIIPGYTLQAKYKIQS